MSKTDLMRQEKASKNKPQKNTDDSLKRAYASARAALDKKAENVVLLNLGPNSGFADYFLICSAMSPPQVQAVADSVRSELKKEFSLNPLSIEGYTEARWVLIDFGDVIIHVFLDPIRDYYQLEGFWSDAIRVPIPAEFYGPGATSGFSGTLS